MLEHVCRQLFEKYASLGDIVNRTKNAVGDAINGLQSAVEGLVEIPVEELNDLLDGLGGIEVTIPLGLGGDEKDALKCLMSSTSPGFDPGKIDLAVDWSDLPLNLLSKYLNSVQGALGDLMGGILSVNPLGMAGDLLGKLDGLIGSTGLDGILNQLDSLLACLNSYCSSEYPGIPDYAGDIRSTLGLGSDNGFDTSIFSSWNPSSGVVDQLDQVTASVRTVNADIGDLTLPGL